MTTNLAIPTRVKRVVLKLVLAGIPFSAAWGQEPSRPEVELPPVESALPASEPSIAELQAQVAELQELMRASLVRQQALEQRVIELQGGPPDQAVVPVQASSGSESLSSVMPGGPSTSSPPPSFAGPGSGSDAQGRSLMPPGYPGASVADMPAAPLSLNGKTKFGPGFQISSEDDEFVIQFHNLTQVDGRFYQQGGQTFSRDTFAVPRQWFIFNGQLTRPFEYYVALNQGFDNLNLLDAFLNIRFDDRFQIRAGRYKTPFTYEFYGLPINGLITPERSQFFNNFGLNRDVGVMAWGSFLDKRIEYAAGIFNGSRNAFIDADNGKDVAAYVNTRPFAFTDSRMLQNFSVGGSLNAGHQIEPRVPRVLRLNVPTTANAAIGTPFLLFNDGVLESGERALWSLHLAWYYRQLSLIGEWQSGYETYAFAETPLERTRSPVQSYYVAAGYFLTGEEVTSRGVVAPLRPFDIRQGRRGPGALELAFRYNYLNVGDEVFTGGFADPNLWTDEVTSIDLGLNWYMTQYIKVFAGWQHSMFGSPVLLRSEPYEQLQLTSDLFWFRFQVYF
ncbi:OprO/OprP family phosphate-selective porin [Tautonia rosea]|uniref:OprO/OprP family phosphate-selective porin n=1 Tax=Tautonia rosea TaxID=2728037 RepID=UPI00147613BA|nr:porin [Tautonia rosea]